MDSTTPTGTMHADSATSCSQSPPQNTPLRRVRKAKQPFTPSEHTATQKKTTRGNCEDKCNKCNNLVKDNDNGIFCTPCKSWVHYSCAKISEVYVKSLGDKPYRCPVHSEPEPAAPELTDNMLLANTTNLDDSLQSALLNEQIDKLSECDLNDSAEEVDSDDEYDTTLDRLRQELIETKEMLDKKTSVAYDQTNRATKLEDDISELKKRHHEELNKLKQKNTSTLNENTSIRSQIKSLKDDIITRDTTIKSLNEQITNLSKTATSVHSLNQKLARTSKELSDLQLNHSKMSKENDELRHAMLLKDNQFLDLNKTIHNLELQISTHKEVNRGLIAQLRPPDEESTDTEVCTTENTGTSPSVIHVIHESNEESQPSLDVSETTRLNDDTSCHSCVQLKSKIDDLSKTKKNLQTECRDLKTLTANYENIIADLKTEQNKLRLLHESATAELDRSRQYQDILLQNRENTESADQPNNVAVVPNTVEGQITTHPVPEFNPHYHLPLSSLPITDLPEDLSETNSEICPRMWYERNCDGTCGLSHNIDFSKHDICVYEFARTGSCKKRNCLYNHNFPQSIREDPKYINYSKNVRENMKSKRKPNNVSTAGRPSSKKHVQPLMSIVTAYEQRGWPTPWRKPPIHSMKSSPNNSSPQLSRSIQTLQSSPPPPANSLPPLSDGFINQQQFTSFPASSGYSNTPAIPTTIQQPSQPPPVSSAEMFLPLSSAALDNQQQFSIPQPNPSFPGYVNPTTTTVPSQLTTSPHIDSNTQFTAPNSFTLDFLGQLVHHMVNIALLNNQPPTTV